MKLLVTGAKGQLGSDLVAYSRKAGVPCVGAGRRDFDITDRGAVMEFVAGCRPDAVVHCAAYNAVDRAEEEAELCRRVNAEGTANVAAACRAVRAKMMYLSTDYVFDGTKTGLYEAEDPVRPLSVYGRSKAEGEEEVRRGMERFFIVRTSWLFGKNGGNFVKTMLQKAKTGEEVRVVCDQIGSPTYTQDLVPLLLAIVRSEKFGIYHATNEGFCSWADFAEEIMRLTGSRCRVVPVTSAAYAAPARRPENSRLSKRSLTENEFPLLPPWHDALVRFLNKEGEPRTDEKGKKP